MKNLLEGVKVLDLTRVLAGPFCTMVLADLGALVVKVENPDKGDDFRTTGPFTKGESAGFMSLNRNKKSITLNLQSEQGKEVFQKLVPHFDVVVENFRPGVMKKLGLEYDVLKKLNSRIIYAAVSGFGQNGPYAFKAAYDFIISGYSGIMSLCAHPGGEPIRIGIGLVDMVSGLYTAIGILSALRWREINGQGGMLDIGMLDCMIALMENPIARYFVTGVNPPPPGNQHPFMAPMGIYPARDGYIIIAVGNQNLWNSFCQAIGREDLFSHPKFSTNTDRMKNLDELRAVLGDILRKKTSEEWIEIFDRAGIPCGPLNAVDKAVADPQVYHRKMIQEMDHPVAGPIKLCGVPIKFSGLSDSIEGPPPLLGEHTAQVLEVFLGLKERDIQKLRAEKVI